MSHWESKVVAKAYAAARPQYPKEMHAYIAKFLENAVGATTTSRSVGATPVTVVDVGCGTGQATGDLATAIGKRAHVIGVDTSKAQIESAQEEEQKLKRSDRDPITFLVSGAEAFAKIVQPHIPQPHDDTGATTSNPQSVVFVAQAMHWFDIPKFADQCRQYYRFVGSGGGATTGSWLMACTYLLFRTSNAAVNELILKLDSYLMANDFWPRERKHVDDNYMVLTQQLSQEGFMQVGGGSKHEPTATFTYSKPEVTLGGILQYLGTWSGVQRWRAKHKDDVLDGVGDYAKDVLDKFKEDTIAALKADGGSNIKVDEADPESIVLGCEFPVSLFIYSDEGRKSN